MKKLIITTLATTAVALSALAQGSIGSVDTLATCVTYGVGQASPATAANWYIGSITLEVFYAATASVTSGEISAINALNGTAGGGAAALTLLSNYGFVLASSPTLTGTNCGGVTGSVGDGLKGSGYFNFAAPDIGLPGAPTSTTGWLAFYAVGSGTYAGYSGVLAFANATGGNPSGTPPGLVAPITGIDPLGLNLDLTTVPEPATMALMGLGGLSLMLFRRKKS
jgi:hypothetical protein